jgi:SRSO17 transposase
MADDWRDDLAEWLRPFVAELGDRRRARMCPAYVEGLIGPGDRKSVQPMAMRSSGIGYDQLHHFIGGALWDSAPLEKELCRQADVLVGGDEAWLIIDDTALPKKGRASVGVATTVCFGVRQDGQLSDPCIGDVGIERGASHGRASAVPPRELYQRSGAYGSRQGS